MSTQGQRRINWFLVPAAVVWTVNAWRQWGPVAAIGLDVIGVGIAPWTARRWDRPPPERRVEIERRRQERGEVPNWLFAATVVMLVGFIGWLIAVAVQ